MDRESVARTNAIKDNTRAINALTKELKRSNNIAWRIHQDKMGPLTIELDDSESEQDGA